MPDKEPFPRRGHQHKSLEHEKIKSYQHLFYAIYEVIDPPLQVHRIILRRLNTKTKPHYAVCHTWATVDDITKLLLCPKLNTIGEVN